MKKVHVVHHTHWDLEWYFTVHEASIQFAYHMDELLFALENNIIDQYVLDGQMSILDNYLNNNPQNVDRIKNLVIDKRLHIGPWYTQTDELIIRGESIIRNMNLGMDLANKLGGYMDIGYLPDSFGQSKDMPKIYNGFGITKSIFWRGLPNDKTTNREFFWESEDDSKVKVTNIRNGYFIGGSLIESDSCQQLMDIIENGATGDNLLLPVGGDQRYIDFNLRDRILFYNEFLTDYNLIESSYDDFFNSICDKDLTTVKGEFICSSVSKIHRSIYSSRYDHKYMNDKIERRMIYQLEPIMIMAAQLGIEYKKDILDKIWKLLSKNQAHDGAGGCNSDETNKIITARYIEADQLSYSIIDYLVRKISESYINIKDNQLMIFNTLPWNINKITKVKISTKFINFTIIDAFGKQVPFDIISTKKEYSGSIRKEVTTEYKNNFYYIHELLLNVTISSMSFSICQITQLEDSPNNEISCCNEDSIENEFYKIFIKNGKICLLNKSSNTIIDNIIYFEDSGDDGDTYDYSPPINDSILNLFFSNSNIIKNIGNLYTELVIDGKWLTSNNLKDREKNIYNNKIDYKIKIKLKKNNKNIDIHVEIDNNALDHRMRAIISSNFKNKFSYSDTPFGTIKRNVIDSHLNDWKQLGWKEEPTAIYPMIKWVNLHDDKQSYSVFSKGIKEYEIIGDDYNKIALTLFRSIGYLGKPDLLRRPGIASGNEFKYIYTPDSQLQRKLTFKFFLNIDHIYDESEIEKNYLDEVISTPYYQIQNINVFTSSIKYFVSNVLKEKTSPLTSMIVNAPKLVLSSIIKNVKYGGIDVRLYNPSQNNMADGGVITTPQDSYYQFVDLKGTPLSARKRGNYIKLPSFKPGEIKTINIKY